MEEATSHEQHTNPTKGEEREFAPDFCGFQQVEEANTLSEQLGEITCKQQ
ncbi:hypothetical protein [Longirhabdus pacifica]|nr:hypothetical protein [Longirhabdus pacifica]